jgi:hypothetical protein
MDDCKIICIQDEKPEDSSSPKIPRGRLSNGWFAPLDAKYYHNNGNYHYADKMINKKRDWHRRYFTESGIEYNHAGNGASEHDRQQKIDSCMHGVYCITAAAFPKVT